jgi:hypothetical protein
MSLGRGHTSHYSFIPISVCLLSPRRVLHPEWPAESNERRAFPPRTTQITLQYTSTQLRAIDSLGLLRIPAGPGLKGDRLAFEEA